MDEQRIKELATRFVQQHSSVWIYEYQGIVTSSAVPHEKNVLFQVRHPDGAPLEGPVIVLVDEQSGDVRFWEAQSE